MKSNMGKNKMAKALTSLFRDMHRYNRQRVKREAGNTAHCFTPPRRHEMKEEEEGADSPLFDEQDAPNSSALDTNQLLIEEIRTNTQLYERILLFEALDLVSLVSELTEGFREKGRRPPSKKQVMDFCDEYSILYTHREG